MEKLKSLSRMTAVLLTAAALLTACGGTKAGEANKQEAAPPDKEEKIMTAAAVSRSIGELWTLAGGDLVGITKDGMDLSEDAKDIGTLTKPNEEAILSLKPDLVMLTEAIPSQAKLSDQLKSSGVTVYPVDINSFDDYSSVMKDLTEKTGRKDLYKKNVTEVKDRIDSILEKNDKDAEKDKTYLMIRVSATKNKVLKDDYFAADIVNAFGLKNAASDTTDLDDMSLEAIAAADPDYIFIVPQGKDEEAEKAYHAAFADQPVWADLTAVKEGRTFVLPKDMFQYKPNASWDKAYQYIADILSGKTPTE